MSESARAAHLGDLDTIRSIANILRKEIAPQRGGALFLQANDRLGDIGSRVAAATVSPDALCLVGTYEGVVFGFLLGHIVEGQGLIELLGVDPEARTVGIGEAMISAAADWFRDRGCVGMQSTALPGARETKNFYESFGLKAHLLRLHRPLEDQGRSTPERLSMAPQVAVGGVVVDDGAILLVRRAHPPAAGQWSVPGGKLEPGETLAAGVEREVLEETGLLVRCGDHIGTVEAIGDGHHFVIMDFWASPSGENRVLRPGDDAADAQWVPLNELAKIDLVPGMYEFLTRHQILS